MELDELHVHQLGSGMVSERVTIASILPTVAGDLVSPANTSCGQDDRLGPKQVEATLLALLAQPAHDTAILFEEREDGTFHVHFDPLMNAVILQGANHFQPRAVSHMSQAGIACPPKLR